MVVPGMAPPAPRRERPRRRHRRRRRRRSEPRLDALVVSAAPPPRLGGEVRLPVLLVRRGIARERDGADVGRRRRGDVPREPLRRGDVAAERGGVSEAGRREGASGDERVDGEAHDHGRRRGAEAVGGEREGISRGNQWNEALSWLNPSLWHSEFRAEEVWDKAGGNLITYDKHTYIVILAGSFIINHTASYRPQTAVARHIVGSGQLGRIRHISATMNGPLMWLFGDGRNRSWVSKTPWRKTSSCSSEDSAADDGKPSMTGNGYAWGQIAHVLAWIYAVLRADASNPEDGEAVPAKVYCAMSHDSDTGADVSLAAAITCRDGATFSVTGTALLPGSQYADPPVGKHVRVELFGERGSLMYGGDDRISQSGRLELRRTAPGQREDGQSEFPCADLDWSDVLRDASELKDGFYFEDGEQSGTGPGSMKSFLDACRASSTRFSEGKESPRTLANDSLIGLRTVQIIDAMYRSSISGRAEEINGYG
ncbi:hypothetical protein ACHAWF_007982 [Thalassiosira exigua]